MSIGFVRLGDLPNFPFVGGVTNTTWGSANCGTCWRLTFEGTSIDVLAIDYTWDGFNIAWPAFQALTHATGGLLPEVDAFYQQVPASFCGLRS